MTFVYFIALTKKTPNKQTKTLQNLPPVTIHHTMQVHNKHRHCQLWELSLSRMFCYLLVLLKLVSFVLFLGFVVCRDS